jgi:alkyl hydroperoxide reductase subunit AhpF
MSAILEIFVDQECAACAHALTMAKTIAEKMPEVEVRILDLTLPNIERPPSVFAVPTYLLNGKTLSLGNPRLDDLIVQLKDSI